MASGNRQSCRKNEFILCDDGATATWYCGSTARSARYQLEHVGKERAGKGAAQVHSCGHLSSIACTSLLTRYNSCWKRWRVESCQTTCMNKFALKRVQGAAAHQLVGGMRTLAQHFVTREQAGRPEEAQKPSPLAVLPAWSALGGSGDLLPTCALSPAGDLLLAGDLSPLELPAAYEGLSACGSEVLGQLLHT